MTLNNIVFFDSECIVCNRLATFILINDKNHKIKLAPIDGNTYSSLELSSELKKMDTILFYQDSNIHYKIDAVSKILKLMGSPYLILGILVKFIPNFCYDLFAKYRFRIFGKVEHCALIPKDLKQYILD